MEHRDTADLTTSAYCEFAPRPELREHVRAIAWYGPAHARPLRPPRREFHLRNDVALTPTFADSQISVLFPVGFAYRNGAWESSNETAGTVMGPVTRVTQPGARAAMIGVYLRPGSAGALLELPAAELTDSIVPLDELWGGRAAEQEPMTLEAVEALLVRRLNRAKPPHRAKHIAQLSTHVLSCGGRASVAQMSGLTGLSRQHLRRLFLQFVGVSPKLFARLARFRTALGNVPGMANDGTWSRVAAELGYADQSHLIAEFREFAGFSPGQLTPSARFHPFVGDAEG